MGLIWLIQFRKIIFSSALYKEFRSAMWCWKWVMSVMTFLFRHLVYSWRMRRMLLTDLYMQIVNHLPTGIRSEPVRLLWFLEVINNEYGSGTPDMQNCGLMMSISDKAPEIILADIEYKDKNVRLVYSLRLTTSTLSKSKTMISGRIGWCFWLMVICISISMNFRSTDFL